MSISYGDTNMKPQLTNYKLIEAIYLVKINHI